MEDAEEVADRNPELETRWLSAAEDFPLSVNFDPKICQREARRENETGKPVAPWESHR